MPIYTYRDEQTGFEKDVIHSMSEIDNPSPETLKEITHEGRVMKRVPALVAVTCSAGISRSGAIRNFKNMTDSQKRDFARQRLNRSSEHFKKSGTAEKRQVMNQEFKKDAINTFGKK